MIFKRIILLIRKGEFKFVIHGIVKRLSSEIISIGLKKDLFDDFQHPNALIDLKIRLAKASDHLYFSEENTNFGLVEKDIRSCYVATDTDDKPCFRNWLLEPSQNDKIMGFFHSFFPILKEDEALLEGGFTVNSYRGEHIMAAAISRISERGMDIGARYVLAFVDIKNSYSLKGCKRAGFNPYSIRQEKWFLFKQKVRFTDIPPELLEKYNHLTRF